MQIRTYVRATDALCRESGKGRATGELGVCALGTQERQSSAFHGALLRADSDVYWPKGDETGRGTACPGAYRIEIPAVEHTVPEAYPL